MVDTVTTPASRDQTLSDTLTMVDTVTTPGSRDQTLSDTLTMVDTVTTPGSRDQTLSDTLTMVDTVTTPASRVQTLSDTLTMIDGISVTKTVTISDTLVLADTTPQNVAISLADTLTISAEMTKSIIHSVSDTLVIEGSLPGIATFTQTITETMSLSEIVTIHRDSPITVSDTLSLVDNVQTYLSGGIINLAETLTFDIIINPGSVSRTLVESVDLSDVIERTHIIPTPVGTLIPKNFLAGDGNICGGALHFLDVSIAGMTSVTPRKTGPAVPSGFTLVPFCTSDLYIRPIA